MVWHFLSQYVLVLHLLHRFNGVVANAAGLQHNEHMGMQLISVIIVLVEAGVLDTIATLKKFLDRIVC